jgi:GTP-sensing pleiotropic transcriptional regulator CodY
LQTLAETHRRFLAEAWQMSADTPEQVEIAIGASEDTTESDTSAYPLEVPISLYGQVLGTIVLESETPWSEEDKDFATQAGAQLALAIENLYLTQHAQQSARENRLVSDLSERLGATLDLDTILQTALREFQQILDVSEAEIHLVAPEATE